MAMAPFAPPEFADRKATLELHRQPLIARDHGHDWGRKMR